MKDRHTLPTALQLCTHPLDLDSHDNNLLINIYNVQNSVVIGSKDLIKFAESLPNGFMLQFKKSSHNGSKTKERLFGWE